MIAILFLALIMLVPGSVLLATPAQATSDSEIPSLLVVDGWTHEVPLKAIRDSSGAIETQDDFEIEAEDIVTVQKNADLVIVPSEGKVDSVKVTDTQKKTTELAFNKLVAKQGLAPKSYLLDVVVLMDNGDKYAYETILTVLESGQVLNDDNKEDIIQSFTIITIDIRIVFKDSPDKPEPTKEEICRYTPSHPICAPVDGVCDEGFNMNEDGQCFTDGPCPPEYARPNDDETGACVEKDGNLDQCKDGSWKYITDSCYGEDPTPPIGLLDNSTDSDSNSSGGSSDDNSTSDEPKNDICLTSFGPPPNCDEVPEENASADPVEDQIEEVPEEEEDLQNVEVEEEPEESEEEEENEESEAEGETNSGGGSEFD